MNLLMLSGDTTLARGLDGAFNQMLRRFSAYWDRIDVICPRAPGAEARRVHDNVYLHPSSWHVALQPLFIFRQGRRLFKERSYALVISHDFGVFYNGIGARLLTTGTHIPYVSEIHHVEGYPIAASRRERLYRFLAGWYVRLSNPAAFRAVNQTEIPEFLRRHGVTDEKILVLPSLYIDFEIFRPLPESKIYDALFVGRLASNKGLFTLLDALAMVKQTHPEIRLCMVGQGAMYDDVMRKIETLKLTNNVTSIPHLESSAELAACYNQSKMLVCASTSEGGPRVTVEAMACGVPVITTPVGIMRDIVTDGETGILFNWDSTTLAEKIRLLLDDDPLRNSIAAGGRLAVQDFQADAVIERYARAYHDFIEQISPKT